MLIVVPNKRRSAVRRNTFMGKTIGIDLGTTNSCVAFM